MTPLSSAGPVGAPAEVVVGATDPVRPSLLDRAVRADVTALGTLPAPVLARLAGEPLVIDGQRLEP